MALYPISSCLSKFIAAIHLWFDCSTTCAGRSLWLISIYSMHRTVSLPVIDRGRLGSRACYVEAGKAAARADDFYRYIDNE
ncbi:hypothetical protein CaCOL14_012413 [Colletotrichum acutatum]